MASSITPLPQDEATCSTIQQEASSSTIQEETTREKSELTAGAMSSEDEMNSFVADAVEYIQKTMSRERLQFLLTDDAAWENFVTSAHLSREEIDALREGLNTLGKDTEDTGDRKHTEDSELKEQEYRERFLKEFPRVKGQLEELIAQLHALADKADKVHRDCTISNVVASSTGIVSGILTIIGLALAPVTVGASLALSATGLGLGAAATVTKVSTSIVEFSTKSSVEAKAKLLESDGINAAKAVKKVVCDGSPKNLPLGDNSTKHGTSTSKEADARDLAQIHCNLAASASNLIVAGTNVSVQGSRVMREVLKDTAQAAGKGFRVLGMGAAAAFLLMDVVNLVQESIDLHTKAKTKSATKLRQDARKLEKMLEELKMFNDNLQKMQ